MTSNKRPDGVSGTNTYLKGLFHGIRTLLTGMKITGREFFTKKVTEQYPENRKELKMYDRFRGTLIMPRDEQGNNKCIACGLCQMACPNETIRLTTDTVTDPETGRKKKVLVKYEYDLGSCMFCQLCVNICPHQAIVFDTAFEHAVYNRGKLVRILNKPGKSAREPSPSGRTHGEPLSAPNPQTEKAEAALHRSTTGANQPLTEK